MAIPAGGLITAAVLDQLSAKAACDFLLFHTGWSRHWGRPAYFEGFPVCSPDLARQLAGTAVKGVGFDTISIDAVQATDLSNHRRLLAAGKIIIENMTGLASVSGKAFHLACFPLKVAAGDGSPVRAVAML
jgi:kynurenine formamidase